MTTRKIFCFLLVLILSGSCFAAIAQALLPENDYYNQDNRFNVIFVTDASGSMKNSDPSGLRFEAIDLFIDLLTYRGNYLGGIAFSTGIDAQMEPRLVSSAEDKQAVSDLLRGVDPSGYTNTGEALGTALEYLISKGNPDLPSVVVFLSDGNTEMPSDEETEESIMKKEEAIQVAREHGIAIYSVCLNHNGRADTTEMDQISRATGGLFTEVADADGLTDVFNTFYDLIYGTSTFQLYGGEFPESGIVEKEYYIPGVGVEEINIVIYGKTNSLEVLRPDGSVDDAIVHRRNKFTLVKITDIVPGTWKVVASGVPRDSIKINMVYNTNLGVDVTLDPEGGSYFVGDEVFLRAQLRSGAMTANDPEQYSGFSAELLVFNAYEDLLGRKPMQLVGNAFEIKLDSQEGVYKYVVSVTGNYLSKDSEMTGPVKFAVAPPPTAVPSVTADPGAVVTPEPTPVPNRAPEAVEDKIEKTFYIWPFIKKDYVVDMNGLANDAEDKDLRYKVVSSSFMDDDYEVSPDNKINIKNFSLSKGAFTVRAYDSEGETCDIEVIVKSRRVAVIALIAIGAAALIVLAALGIGTYILLNKRFMGACYVRKFDETGSYYEEVKREKGRGRIPLSAFNVSDVGFDVSKCYFQATGKNYARFISKSGKICSGGRMDKEFRVDGGGYEITITADPNSTKGIYVKFVSRLNNANYGF